MHRSLRTCLGGSLAASLLSSLVAGAALAQISGPPDYVLRQLSPALHVGSVSASYAIDRRGEWVVFVGDLEFNGLFAVYSIRRHASGFRRLSPYAPEGAIGPLNLTPDGQRVIFTAELVTPTIAELWSNSLNGSPTSLVRLSGDVSGGNGVLDVIVPAQGTRVVFRASGIAGGEVWSVPFAGPATAAVSLLPELLPGESPNGMQVTPDGTRAILSLYDSPDASRLWSVPVAGPIDAGTFLSPVVPDCQIRLIRSQPGSTRLVYSLGCGTSGSQSWRELRSVPFDGPPEATISLAGEIVPGGEILSGGIVVSPDGARVLFHADKAVPDRIELWSAPIAGPPREPVRLNPLLPPAADVYLVGIAPDSSRVVYIVDAVVDGQFAPWTVPLAGPSAAATPLVSGIVALGGAATEARFTPDSQTIVLRGDLTVNDRFDLYAVPADGSAAPNRITNDSTIPGPELSVTSSWAIHPVGGRLTFIFDEESPSDRRGLGEQRINPEYAQDARLNLEPEPGGRVSSFLIFPDGAGTLYRSDEEETGDDQLYVVDTRIFGDGFEEGAPGAWFVSP